MPTFKHVLILYIYIYTYVNCVLLCKKTRYANRNSVWSVFWYNLEILNTIIGFFFFYSVINVLIRLIYRQYRNVDFTPHSLVTVQSQRD